MLAGLHHRSMVTETVYGLDIKALQTSGIQIMRRAKRGWRI